MSLALRILISLFAFQTLIENSFAFTLNSSTNPNLEGWTESDVILLVNTSNCPAGIDVPSLIAAAAEIWNNVPTSSVKVSYGGSTTSTAMASPTTVYCETNFQVVTGLDQNAVPGAASVNGSTGRITQGILYLNASAGLGNITNFDANVLKIIIAHEIGHILGLGHSETANALMYYDASARNTLSLAQDDIDGISYLYPSNEFSNNKYAGCAYIENISPPSSSSMVAILLVFLLPLVVYHKLQRASALDRLLAKAQ